VQPKAINDTGNGPRTIFSAIHQIIHKPELTLFQKLVVYATNFHLLLVSNFSTSIFRYMNRTMKKRL
jgi:hypothetical protein